MLITELMQSLPQGAGRRDFSSIQQNSSSPTQQQLDAFLLLQTGDGSPSFQLRSMLSCRIKIITILLRPSFFGDPRTWKFVTGFSFTSYISYLKMQDLLTLGSSRFRSILYTSKCLSFVSTITQHTFESDMKVLEILETFEGSSYLWTKYLLKADKMKTLLFLVA